MVVAAALVSGTAFAQTSGPAVIEPTVASVPASSPADSVAEAPPGPAILAKNTPVVLELAEPVGSKKSQVGDHFSLRLRDPIIVDGKIVAPAGIIGVGEVIHVAKAGFGGKPGEILIAARYLEWGSIRFPLRSMRIGVSGDDRTGQAVAAGMVLLPLAFVIPGGEIEIPAGTSATARLAADVPLTVTAASASPPVSIPPAAQEPGQ